MSAFWETRAHDFFVRVCSILAGAAGGGLTISPVQSMAVSCGSEEARGAWVTALRAAVALCVTLQGDLLVHEGTVRGQVLWLVLWDHAHACACEGSTRDGSSRRCACPCLLRATELDAVQCTPPGRYAVLDGPNWRDGV